MIINPQNPFDEVFEHAVRSKRIKFKNDFEKSVEKSLRNIGFNDWLSSKYDMKFIESNYDILCTDRNFNRYLRSTKSIKRTVKLRYGQFAKWLKKDENLRWFLGIIALLIIAAIGWRIAWVIGHLPKH